ncbi:transmembrane protein 70 homolog, mitochondrial-like [Haliotis cracherodii]|uniref:transmembrane protein 70 homolog, mitochondrial-like n=1 Tax=Haliotis cracherodii TaxID=6455 RepID=UPI0039E7DF14
MKLLGQIIQQVKGHYGMTLTCGRTKFQLGNRITPLSAFSRSFASETNQDALTEMPLKHPVKGELVYGGPLWKMVKGIKAFSVSTSMIGLGLQPYILMNAGEAAMFSKVMIGGTISFFIFITPLLIHFVTKKYVTYCYLNRDTGSFTAATYSFFLRRKEIEFTAEDVVVPDIPGMFTTVLVKGKPLFLDARMFYSKDAYIHFMGYDKPIDWTMPDYSKKPKKET